MNETSATLNRPQVDRPDLEQARADQADDEPKLKDQEEVQEEVQVEADKPDEVIKEQAENLAKLPDKVEVQVEQKPNLFDRLLAESSKWNLVISVVNALLHFVATVTSFDNFKNNPLMQSLSKISDKSAFIFTKYLAPICSYGLATIDSLRKGKLVQAVIKILPPGLLPMVGDSNIDTVYGSSTGLNCPYNMLENRIKYKSAVSEDFKKYADEANKTMLGNAKMLWHEFKEMSKHFMQGRLTKEFSLYMIQCPMILLGSIPILLFGRNDRDTFLAKSMGLIRSIGGILGDIGFGFYGKEHYKKLIGGFCGMAALADIAKRWTGSEILARALIHLGAALNVSGYAVWNAFDSSDKEAVEEISDAAQIRNYSMEELETNLALAA